MRETITLEQFHNRLKSQNVPREHLAFICPVCKTVQSIRSLKEAGVADDKLESYIGFSCVGRFTKAGPHTKDAEPGKGCDWTLGGLLHLHTLEVETPGNGVKCPRFEVATPEQAIALMGTWT